MRLLLKLTALALCTTLFQACLTPRKVDRWIDHEYGPTIQNKGRKSDYISFIMPADSSADDIVAITEKRKMKLLPLLFYWQWEYGTYSTLNDAVPGNYLQSALVPYANGKGLKQKLAGAKLELKVEELPKSFSLVDKGGLVFLLLFYFSWDKIFVDPKPQDLIVSYRIVKDGAEQQKGTITVKDRNKPVNVKVFKSVKKTFWEYLATYQGNMQAMSKEVVDQLLVQLKA